MRISFRKKFLLHMAIFHFLDIFILSRKEVGQFIFRAWQMTNFNVEVRERQCYPHEIGRRLLAATEKKYATRVSIHDYFLGESKVELQ